MTMQRLFVTLAAGGAALSLTGGVAAQERFPVGSDRVAVYNLAGTMRVEPGSGSSVVVEVTRGGSDAGRLSVRRTDSGGTGVVAVVYPDGDIVYPEMGGGSRTTLEVRSDGTFGGDGAGRLLGRDRITIRGSGRGTRAWANVRVLVPSGRSVTVHHAVGRIDVANVNGDVQVKGYAAAITASGTRGKLDLDTGSGGITVTNAEGEVTLDTGSGGVRVNGIRGSGLDVDTGSGGVTGSDLSVGRLHVDVGSGGVRLEAVDARDVEIDTGSGSVVLRLRRDAEEVKIDTGSGGVTLGLPQGFGADAEIDTGSGGIRVDVPSTVRRSTRSHFSGTIGDGSGRLVIDTGSGGVSVVRN
jgi:lia operon protein LiaG